MNERSHNSRRGFIKTIGTMTASALGAAAALRETSALAAGSDLIFSTPIAALSLGGGSNFMITDAEGGYPVIPVVENPENAVVRKSLGEPPIFRDFSLGLGGDLPTAFRTVLNNFLNRTQTPVDGSVSYLDSNLARRGSLDFQDGVITEFTIPAADASSQQTLNLTAKMSIASGKRNPGDLAKVTALAAKTRILAANFRLRVDGLDSVFSRTSKISPILVSRPVLARDGSSITLGPMNVSDLVTTVAESGAKPLYDWFDQNLGGASAERNGTLEFLSADLTKVVVGFRLKNINLWWLADQDGIGDSLRRVTAKMYVEELSLI